MRSGFDQAGVAFDPTVEVRYCNTARVLASARVGVSVVDPFSPTQGGNHNVVVRPFRPTTPAVAHVLWSEAQPLSRLAAAFLDQIRASSHLAPAGAKKTELRGHKTGPTA